jgi:large subunit ribosomal protein L24
MNIKKGDTVVVIAGNDKGAQGEVVRLLPTENRLVVQGVNVRKKHQRQAQTQARQRQIRPGIIQFDAPIHASNVMLLCPKCNTPARVGRQRDEASGKSRRVCRNCGELID